MKRLIKVITVFILSIFVVTGCNKTISVTYNVQTGDKVEVVLNTKENYKLTTDVPFKINRGDDLVTIGQFLTEDGYQYYVSTIATDPKVSDKREDKKDDHTYVYWTYDNRSYEYLIYLKDSKTAVLLVTDTTKEDADKVFDMLQFNLK